MPMSLGMGLGLGMGGGVFDTYAYTNAEAKALVSRMSVKPTDLRKAAIDAYYSAIKTGATSGSNILAKLDFDHLYAAHSQQAANLNWAGNSAYDAVPVASPTFTVDQGYTGNGSTAYLAMGYTAGISAGVASQNSSHIGAYSLTDSNTTTVEIGSNALSIRLRDTGNFRTQINAGSSATVAVADSLGHFVASRTASAVVGRYKNGTSLGDDTGTASSAVVNSPMLVLGRNGATNGSITLSLPTARQLSSAHAGSGLTALEVADLYNAKLAYMVSVGATPPLMARAAGFNTNTMATKSFSTSNFDSTDSRGTGFQWYYWNWFTSNPPPQDVRFNPGGSITIKGNNGVAKICTMVKRPAGQHRGMAFGGGGYFEAIISYDPSTATDSTPWSFWMNAYENLKDNSQWPGQAAGFGHFVEWDIFEAYFPEPTKHHSTIHDTYGIYGTTCAPGWCRSTSENVIDLPGVDRRKPHIISGLWIPATPSSQGSLTEYFDGVQAGASRTYDLYDGPNMSPPITAATSWRFGVIDNNQMVPIFGCDNDMTIHAVNVWQKDASANFVGSA